MFPFCVKKKKNEWVEREVICKNLLLLKTSLYLKSPKASCHAAQSTGLGCEAAGHPGTLGLPTGVNHCGNLPSADM